MSPVQPSSPRRETPSSLHTEALDYDSDDPSIPAELKCPITRGLMVNPVVFSDGSSCEEHAARNWLEINAERPSVLGPITNQPLSHRHLAPNLSLISVMETHFPRAAALRAQRLAARPRVPAAPAVPHVAPAPLFPRETWIIGAIMGGYFGLLGGEALGAQHANVFALTDPRWPLRIGGMLGMTWISLFSALWIHRVQINDMVVAHRLARLLFQPFFGAGLGVSMAYLVGALGTPRECWLNPDMFSCLHPPRLIAARLAYITCSMIIMGNALGSLRGVLVR